MMSSTSETEPTSPVSDGSFEFITAREDSSDGGFESDSTLGSNDIVLSPHVVQVPLAHAPGETSESLLATSDVEDNDLVLVERGHSIAASVSVTSRSRAASVSSHAIPTAVPITVVSNADGPANELSEHNPQRAAVMNLPSSSAFPAVVEETSRAPTPSLATSSPLTFPATPLSSNDSPDIENGSGRAMEPFSQPTSTTFPVVIEELSRPPTPAAAATPLPIAPTLGGPNVSAKLMANHPLADSFEIPATLEVASYKKKSRTLTALKRLGNQLRELVRLIEAVGAGALILDASVPNRPRTLQGVMNTRANVWEQVEACMSAALRRVDVKQANKQAAPKVSSTTTVAVLSKKQRKKANKKAKMAAKRASNGVASASASPTSTPPPPIPEQLDEQAIELRVKAVAHMNLHLELPPEMQTTSDRLLTCQSILVELGVIFTPDALPSTISAARKIFWSYVHINVRDYLEVREKGMLALREVMLPNKGALRKDVRKRKMPVKQIKELGLGDLLVQAFGPH